MPSQGWQEEGGALVLHRSFGDFAEALAYVNAVGAVAEAAGHHPDISLHGWRNVTLRLCTHSAGGAITERDHDLAGRIDRLEEA